MLNAGASQSNVALRMTDSFQGKDSVMNDSHIKETGQNDPGRGTYKGEWKANKMHGFGVFKWASGRLYIGYWSSDKKSGCGKLIFK